MYEAIHPKQMRPLQKKKDLARHNIFYAKAGKEYFYKVTKQGNMKKLLLLLILSTTIQTAQAQSSSTSSADVSVTAFGTTDTINSNSSYGVLAPYDSNFIKQPMKTSFMVVNDTLYLLDSLKNDSAPSLFYSKIIGADSVQVVLDTLPSYYDLNAYRDEDFPLFGPSFPIHFQHKEIKLKLGHVSLVGKNIRYKSIWYNIKYINSNLVETTPNWQSKNLSPDTSLASILAPDFFIQQEGNSILFYHQAFISPVGYNLNLSPIKNDTLYAELYPSRIMFVPVPLRQAKTRATMWYGTRFEVADLGAFTDTLTIGYYHERASFDRKQFFSWVQVVKAPNNTISYSHSVQPNALNFLPIKKLTLSATAGSSENIVKWVTVGEENIDRFELQKSGDGTTFETICQALAKGQQGETTYSYTDNYPFANSYYRIRAVDMEGQFTYSHVVLVLKSRIEALSISPNPSKGDFILNGLSNTDYRIKVTTLDGKVIYEKMIAIDNGKFNLALGNKPSGIYLLSVRNLESGEFYTEKIIKE